MANLKNFLIPCAGVTYGRTPLAKHPFFRIKCASSSNYGGPSFAPKPHPKGQLDATYAETKEMLDLLLFPAYRRPPALRQPPPIVDLDTGEAHWPIVKEDDICGCFRYADENHIDRDHWPKNDLPIYRDLFGDYCKIPLGKQTFAKVDPEDYIWLSQFKWFCQTGAGKKSYAARYGPRNNKPRQKAILMHRLLADTPQALVCDHINGHSLDNRKNNLRNCTRQQNNLNARPHRNATSRFKGVYWHKAVRKWNAVIHLNGKRMHLGYFQNEIHAAKTYDQAARKLHGEYASLNFAGSK